MKVRFVIMLTFVLCRVVVFAQTERTEVHLNDSTQIYFFDLFNEDKVMQWGTVPKNFPFMVYRVYLKNNSSDTLKVGRVTTSDGRVTYHYNSRTKIIYPNEYVVLKPLHNGTKIRHRHGRFNRQVQITLQAVDTTYLAYHYYRGEFSGDTIYPKYTSSMPDEPLLPRRKPEELEADRRMIAETDRKLEASGQKRTNYIYVIYNDSIFSKPHHVYSRTKWRSIPMPLEIEGIPHYLFNLYSNETMIRIELGDFHDERIHLKLEPNKGKYICANYGGETKYFSTKEACENYIKGLNIDNITK